MRKIFTLLSASLLLLGSSLKAQEVTEYHFQEGFSKSTPTAWTRTSGSTTATVHTATPPLSFAGAYAAKFDAACVDESFYLETPQYTNVGTLSFYIAKNANNTLMDLHVLKIVDGVATEIKTVDAFEAPSKTANWALISIVVNEAAGTKFKFYSTIRTGNAAWFSIDDIELTKMSGTIEPPAEGLAKISTDFGDGTWGEILASNPVSASYPSSEVNGFSLQQAAVIKSSMTCPSGERHTNRIGLDKLSNGGAIVFPLLKDVGEVEFHAAAGTIGNTFKLEELVNGNWITIDTYSARKTPDSVYVATLNRNTATQLRLANNSGGAILIYKIVTRTYQETVELNITSTTPAETGVCYYNLTKTVLLTFNKEVEFGTGDISLNGVSIPIANCTINGKVVTVPVILEGNPAGKSYTMIVPQGAFVEKGNAASQSNAKTFSFGTFRTVAVPSGYDSQIDVLYSTANVNQNRMDIYYPTSASKPVPVIINIHGGGWNHGEKESQSGFNVYFNMGMAVANIEYRMTPQATAPAAVEDTRCAMRYLVKNAAALNIDPTKIILQGGSAGGHLALTAGYLQNDERFDTGCNTSTYADSYKVIAVIDKYGPSDLVGFMFYSSLVAWLGDYKNDVEFIKSISPVQLVDANTPPTYIIHGDADPTVPYSQSQILVDALQTAGVKYQFTTVPGGLHGGFPAEYNTQMNNEVTAFLTEILNDLTVGIGENLNDEKNVISFIDNTLYLNTESDVKTAIFDLSGKKIISSDKKEISLKNLDSGIFIVKAVSKDGSYSEKISK